MNKPGHTKGDFETWGRHLLSVATDIVTHHGHVIKRIDDAWFAYPSRDGRRPGDVVKTPDARPKRFQSAGDAYRACCEEAANHHLLTKDPFP